MEIRFCERSFTLTLTLPTKRGEGSKSKRFRALFFVKGLWLGLNQDQFRKMLENVYDAGHHAGAMNPYC